MGKRAAFAAASAVVVAASAGAAAATSRATPVAPTGQQVRVEAGADVLFPEGWAEGRRRAVVIGGGVAGVATALQLSGRGVAVTLVEAGGGVGRECSAAALGSMQRTSIVVDSDVWLGTLRNMLGLDPHDHRYVRVDWGRVLASPQWWHWMLDFTRSSLLTPAADQRRRIGACHAFANWAVDLMLEAPVGDRGQLQAAAGCLQLAWGEPPADKPERGHEETRAIGAAEVLELEPCLRSTVAARPPGLAPLAGAEHQPYAARGHCGWSTEGLYAALPPGHTRALLGTAVEAFEFDGERRVRTIVTEDGRRLDVPEDAAVVVAAGAWTAPLLRRAAGLYAPVYPLKGYTLELDVSRCEEGRVPRHTVVDPDEHLFAARYGDQLRVSSIGEFSGWDGRRLDEAVTRDLRAATRRLLPQLSDEIEASPVVTGLRPYVADGAPLVGPLGGNLFVNTGPGSNGWKNALGTGELAARHVCGESFDDLPFEASLFTPDGRVRGAWF